jgi:hypothetical protein
MVARVAALLGMLVICCAALGCPPQPLADSPSTEPSASVPVPVPAAVVATGPAAPLVDEEPGPKRSEPFGTTPLSPLARQVTALVMAALRGEPLPTAIPTEPIDPERVVSWGDDPRPDSDSLEILAFAIEIDIALPVTGATAPGGSGDQTVRAFVLLSRSGLKIAKLGLRGPDRAALLPAWLEGAHAVAADVVSAARQGKLAAMVLSESEAASYGKQAEGLVDELPTQTRIDEVQSLVRAAGEPVGTEVDRLGLLVRDASGRLYSCVLNVDEHRGKTVLDSRPLVRVRMPK